MAWPTFTQPSAQGHPIEFSPWCRISLVYEQWSQVRCMHHSKTWGISQKAIKHYKTGMKKNYARCAWKSCTFLRRGGFLTTILVSLSLKDYLNHYLIAFHFLFLKSIGMKQWLFVKERKTNNITKWVLCPALMQMSHMALGNTFHSFVLSLFVEQEC